MPSYRLDQEPWIPVEMIRGGHRLISLIEAFNEADKIRRIAGNPLEAAVLHRLLLAILHRSATISSAEEWSHAWQNRRHVMQMAIDYIRKNSSSFDLYDEKQPFLQHPDIPPGDKNMAVLLHDRSRGNNAVFFDASFDQDPYPVDSGTAARSILVNFAYGGAHPDPSNPLSSGKENTMFAGPLCAKIIGILQGVDLERTLLLNLLYKETAGLPAWERSIPSRPTETDCEGICDRYTRMTRFIRLKPSEDGSMALSTALHMGERIREDEDLPGDPMMPFYLASDKKLKPQRLDSEKALWRSAHVLLNCLQNNNEVPIKALSQLNILVNYAAIDETEEVSLRVLGFCGDAQGPKTDLWRDEMLPFRLSVVVHEETFAKLRKAVEAAEAEADRLRSRLARFAKRFLQASGPSPDPEAVKTLVREIAPGLNDYWSEISPIGERLGLAEIDLNAWEELIKKASYATYNKAVESLPPTARRLQAQFAFGTN